MDSTPFESALNHRGALGGLAKEPEPIRAIYYSNQLKTRSISELFTG